MERDQQDVATLLHDLHVHQTELEVQNRELRESREALEASRARYADLFDFAPVGYMSLDANGCIVEINLCGAEMLGHERLRVLGKPLRVLVRLDEPDSIFTHLRECMATRAATKSEIGFVRKGDDAHLYVQAASVPVCGPDGSPAGCRTAFIDITERKRVAREREQALEREQAARQGLEQARVAAEQANRLKDEFLSVVSHELRTPLNAILGWSYMLTSTHADDAAKVHHGLEVIRRNAEAQKRLVEDILDVSRIITGKLRIELQPTRLEDAVRAAIESMQPTAVAKRVALSLQVGVEARVMADGDRLQQVVWNLLSNAIKFTPSGGRVEVAIEEEGDEVLVRVRDDGAGVDPVALPWIFDRFRQVDPSPSRMNGGLGLGLAIVRHLVELHGGKVWGESRGAGTGSTFVIALPRASGEQGKSVPPPPRAPTAEPPTATPGSHPRLTGVHVLVVEDNEDARVLAAALLEAAGATVTVAGGAADGLRQFRQRVPDVLVSDLAMPGEDGLMLIARIREMPGPPGKVPAVAMTAHARPEDAQAARSAGYDEHVAKPLTPQTLIDATARLARRA